MPARPPPACSTKKMNRKVPTHMMMPWIVSVMTTAVKPPKEVYTITTMEKITREAQ